MTHWVPELLAPAGSLEKLKVAVLYGANAIYLGGQKFGLRTAADNFTLPELEEGVNFAHQHGSAVYVVLNSFLHDEDLDDLPEFLKVLESLKVDAVIVSDLGVIETVMCTSNLEVHLSTQASCLNIEAAKLWKKMGITRVVLGREVSIYEAAAIKKASGLEVEMFVHGSMCMAYSGNCVISNYTQGRDSNRGGCAHSCRFEYSLETKNDLKPQRVQNTFMSSKDLLGIRALKEFIEAGIDSLKVEGRMKSHHYAGTVSKIYAQALQFYAEYGTKPKNDFQRELFQSREESWQKELEKLSHRDYTQGNLTQKAQRGSIYDERDQLVKDYVISGLVVESRAQKHLLVQVRSAFKPGERLELVPFKGESISFELQEFYDLSGHKVEKSKPGQLVKIPWLKEAMPWNLIRRAP